MVPYFVVLRVPGALPTMGRPPFSFSRRRPEPLLALPPAARNALASLCMAALLVAPGLAAAQSAAPRAGYRPLVEAADTVSIDAGTLREAPATSELFLSGGVAMAGAHWRLTAASGRVLGELAMPRRVDLYGVAEQPARLWLRRRDAAPGSAASTLTRETVSFYAEGQRIVYEREPEQLVVTGRGLVEEDGKVLRGERLVYDLATETLRVAGEGGVRFTLDPAVDDALDPN